MILFAYNLRLGGCGASHRRECKLSLWMKLRLSSAGSPALKRDASMKPKFGGGTSLRVAWRSREGS
jgi:hypothetical protein